MAWKRPNVVVVFGDQWRAQATGYSGNSDVKTPNLDKLARESLDLTNAVSGCPVCCPARASLLTGQYPLTHGVFVNNVPLLTESAGMGEVYRGAGYDTAYIGKWHVSGGSRSAYIPLERRRGFEYWKVLECTHDYYNSHYFAGDSDDVLTWDGYDAIAQTRDAICYINTHNKSGPFLLVLSWGPPHDPYDTAPPEFKALYQPGSVSLRPNVPLKMADATRYVTAGYYSHCSALDACLGELLRCLATNGIEDDTLVVFCSDHGDMLGSRGMVKKQHPWDESIRIPFLIRYPALLGREGRNDPLPINMPDILPTLLGFCGLSIPSSVEGRDWSERLVSGNASDDESALIACYQPFGEWAAFLGGREYRGLRNERYTYVRSLHGPWLLYDNFIDPYQMNNLVNVHRYREIQSELEICLRRRLDELHDEFRPGLEYIKQWSYKVNSTGTVPFVL